MNRRSFITAIGASSVTPLSGCTSGGPGTAATTTGSGGNASTPEISEYDYPAGVSGAGVEDVERLNEQMNDTAENTSFAFDCQTKMTGDTNYEVTETVRYDSESEQGLTRVEGTADGTAVGHVIYESGSMVYMKENKDGQVEYSTYDLSTAENRFSRRTALDTVRENLDFVDSLTYEVDGVEVRGGRAVAVLTITGITDDSTSQISDPSGELYVSEDALAVEFHYEATVRESTLERDGTFSDVGDTTVEKPDWVQKAKDS